MLKTSETNVVSLIQEHCKYCPEDLGIVAQALLSVEDNLDYTMKYELEYLLSRYVIARAKEEPEGLQSIIDKFPVPTGDSNTSVEESLKQAYENINNKIIEIASSSDSASDFDKLKQSIQSLTSKVEPITEAGHMDDDPKDQDVSSDDKKKKKNKNNTDTDNEDDKDKKVKESLPAIKEAVVPKNLNGLEEFRLASHVTASASDDGSAWTVRLIVEGHTDSGRYFPADVLREAIPLFEGARAYVNHPDENFQGGDRPLESLVGWYDGVTLKEGDGLYATWHILANSGKSYLRDQLVELKEAGKLNLIGLSLLGLGKNSFKKVDGKLVKYSESIDMVRSVDLVDVPGAGGQILEQIKLSDESLTRSEIMSLESMTPEELKEANPVLYEQMIKLSAGSDDKPEEPKNKPEPLRESSNDLKTKEILDRLIIRDSNAAFKELVEASKLPEKMREALKDQFYGKAYEESELEKQINVYREAMSDIAPYSGGQFHLPSEAVLITEEVRMQAAMDMLFGLEVAEELRNTPKLSGIREAYIMVTGDREFTWGAIPLDERLREAYGPTANLVVGGSTVTFSNVLGTSINRRLIDSYRRQTMWWEPFTSITSIANLKQQDRNRIESLGSLTERTTGGEEYVELTWAEFVHTYTPTEHGNLVPIAQRAIVNDDLRSLVRASDELGRSAGITLNEYVSNLFTQNSGDGPTFIDVDQQGNTEAAAEKVFAGSTTAEHNNRIETNLSRAGYKDADLRIRTMGDKDQKRIGLMPSWLLIPVELREVAIQIQQSLQVPDSANNAVNIFANTFGIIEVPQFTDANNWYVMSSRDQIEMIEMGFLNGRREPELFVQADPSQGMVFTHDVINYKIRHRYGGGWLDYRGSIASIVA